MELNFPTFLSAFYFYVSKLFPYALYPNAPITDTPQNQVAQSYDIIILGGTAQACVLANRLSEIPSLKILQIVEFPDETVITDNPLLYVLNTTADNTAGVVPQRRACLANGGRCGIIRGERLGGATAVDGMVYARGAQEDFDQWAKEGFTDWSWKSVFPYFLKMENYKIKPLDRSPYHGTKGPLTIRYPRYRTLLQKEYIRAGNEFGWPQNDYNGETQFGIDYTQFMLDGATRLSAAQAYLNPVAKRKNLTIIKNTKVPRIIINEATKKVEGVEYIRNGKKYTVRANKEVILAKGSLESAQLLILSGIGPREELRRLGIPQICDLPVGKFYQNQPIVDVYFEINKPLTIISDVWRTNTSVYEFARSGEGPLTTTGEEAEVFYNVYDRKKKTTCNAGLRFFSLYPLNNNLNGTQHKQIITANIAVLKPKSVGSVTLKSTLLDDPISVDPNFFQVKEDFIILVEGVRTAIEFMKTPTMSKYSPRLLTDLQPKCDGAPDFAKCIVMYYSTGANRGVGTVRMGSVVTQDQLLVRDIKGLRVVGDSVMPSVIKGVPTVGAMVIAEKTADNIKNYYGIKNLENPIFPLDYNFSHAYNSMNNYSPYSL